MAGDDEQELTEALVRACFAVMAVLSQVGADHDLSLTQLRVLAILRDRSARMSELAGYLGLDRSTISGLVDRAQRRGLLQREPDPEDARAVGVRLTPAGAVLARQGASEVASALAPVLGHLSQADARRLTALLRSVAGPAEQ